MGYLHSLTTMYHLWGQDLTCIHLSPGAQVWHYIDDNLLRRDSFDMLLRTYKSTSPISCSSFWVLESAYSFFTNFTQSHWCCCLQVSTPQMKPLQQKSLESVQIKVNQPSCSCPQRLLHCSGFSNLFPCFLESLDHIWWPRNCPSWPHAVGH